MDKSRIINQWLALLNAAAYSENAEDRYVAIDTSAKVATIAVSILTSALNDENYITRQRAKEALEQLKGIITDVPNT